MNLLLYMKHEQTIYDVFNSDLNFKHESLHLNHVKLGVNICGIFWGIQFHHLIEAEPFFGFRISHHIFFLPFRPVVSGCVSMSIPSSNFCPGPHPNLEALFDANFQYFIMFKPSPSVFQPFLAFIRGVFLAACTAPFF